MYPVRDEDLQFAQEEKKNDEHWLAMLPAVCRIHSQTPALKHYYFDFIPNNDKSASRNSRFKALQETIKNEKKILSLEMVF